MPSTPLRPAGLFERYHITRHLLGLDTCVVLSAKFTCVDGSPLTEENLFPALRKVVGKHPILAVRVQGEDAGPSFVKLEKIELPLVVQFSSGEDLEFAIQRQLSRGFDTQSELPLWRVEVLQDNTVIFAFHHGISDGLGGVAFLSALLAAMQDDAKAESASQMVEMPPPLSLLPPIEVATNVRPSLLKIITEIFSLFAPTSWTAGYSAWTANPVPLNPELDPRLKLIQFTSTEMTAFLALCRSHGATLTSAFYVLAVASFSRLIPPGTPQQYKTLSAFVPVSLRGVARAPADVMADYVAALHTFPPLNPTFSWPAAARYASELHAQKDGTREQIGMLTLLFGNYAGFFRGQLGRKRNGTFEISNAGRVTSGGEGRWRIGSMAFAQCNVVVGPALSLNVIGDPTGGVTVALTWGESAIDSMLVESFSTQFQGAFRALLADRS